MGFIRANMLPILTECKRQRFAGDVLFLGEPDIYFDSGHLERMAKLTKVELNSTPHWIPSEKPDFAQKGYIEGRALFKKLGFQTVSVLDVSAFEGADIIFDLNNCEPPLDLEGKFDVIIDHGTLEHVFHFPNAINNVFKMLKKQGRLIISAPSNNFFDHGFYMFQPTLFQDFFAANNWSIESIKVAQFTHEQETEPPFFVDYEPGLFDSVGYGKMGGRLYCTVCVATKGENSTADVIPQQGWYARRDDWSPE
jgi:hypothetical protein